MALDNRFGGDGSVRSNERRRARRSVALVALGLVGSLLVAGAAPAAAVDGEADSAATYSACLGPALESAGLDDIRRLAAEDAINCLAHYGITKGRTATTYDPGAVVSRWQMALFLVRAAGPAGIDLPTVSDQGFDDIDRIFEEGRNAINQIAELRIMPGSGRSFRPDEAVTRSQMALMLDAFLSEALLGIGALGNISRPDYPDDVDPDDDVFDDIDRVTAREYRAINRMYETGVTLGTSGNRFSPEEPVTRAQMAVFITRMLAHTVARPAGLTLQAEKTSVLLDDSVDLVVSVRNRDHTPSDNVVVDLFSAAKAGDAFNSNGTCDEDEVLPPGGGAGGSKECEIDHADEVTNADGDVELTVNLTESTTLWAWTGDIGDTYDDDRVQAATLRITASKGAASLRVSDDMAANAKYARFGDRVTFTLQLVDEDGEVVAGKDRSVMISEERRVTPSGGSADYSSETRTYKTDAAGRIRLSYRMTDPRSGSRNTGDSATLDLDVSPPSGLDLEDKTTLGNAGADGAGAEDAAVVWSDEAAEPATLTLSQAVSYHEASDTGRGVTNTVTAALVDQYGEPISRKRLNFFSDDQDGIGAAAGGGARLTRTTNRSGRATLSYNRDSGADGIENIWATFTDAGDAGTSADDIDLRSTPEQMAHYWATEASGPVSGRLLEKDTVRNRLIIGEASGGVILVGYDGNDQLNGLDGPVRLADFEKELGYTGKEPTPNPVVTRVRVDTYASSSRGISRITLLGGLVADDTASAKPAQVLLTDDLMPGQTHLNLDRSRTVTFTLQASDSAGRPVRESGWRVTVTSTETPVGGSAGSPQTLSVTTDQEGRASFSFTQAGTATTGETARVTFTTSTAARSGRTLPVVAGTTNAPDADLQYEVSGQDIASAARALVIAKTADYTKASSSGAGASNTVSARIVDQYGQTAAATDTISFLSDDPSGIWADSSGVTSAESGGKRTLTGAAASDNQVAAVAGAASLTYHRDSGQSVIETIWATGGGFTSNRLYHYWTEDMEAADAPLSGRLLAHDASDNRFVISAAEKVLLASYDSNDFLTALDGSGSLSDFEDGLDSAAHVRVGVYHASSSGAGQIALRYGWSSLDHPGGAAAGAEAQFGQAIAADNGVIVVGAGYEAFNCDHDGNSGTPIQECPKAGRVYVYEGMADASPAILTAPAPKENDYFGYDVDIAGDTIVVGAPRVDEMASGATAADNGRVFIYTKPSGGWEGTGIQPAATLTNSGLGTAGTLQARVAGTDHAACSSSSGRNHMFGYGVAVSKDGDTVVVTSRDPRAPVACSTLDESDGLAYVFEKNDNSTAGWDDDDGAGRAVLWPSTTIAVSGSTMQFGRERAVSVSDDGDVIAVGGAERKIGSTAEAGSSYIYVRSGSEWNTSDTAVTSPIQETAVLAAPTALAQQRMGAHVALSGAGDVMAAAGNSHEDEGRNGEIHVFTKPSGGWADSNAPDVLKAGRGRAQDLFGRFVTMTGDGSAVAAGRLHRQEGDFRGSVVLFNRPSGGWADDSSVDEEFLGVKAAGRLGWHTVFDRTTGALYSAHREETATDKQLSTVYLIRR